MLWSAQTGTEMDTEKDIWAVLKAFVLRRYDYNNKRTASNNN